MDMMSDIENMDALLGNGNAKSIERELANVINGSVGNNGMESNSHRMENFSKVNFGTLITKILSQEDGIL